MKRIIPLLVLAIVFLMSVEAVASDPNYVLWPNSMDTRYELRAGLQKGYLEAYVAPNYNVTTDVFGLRVYGLYNAIDTEMAANLLGTTTPLPDGALYGGLYGGWKFEGDQMEGGWLIGGMVEVKENFFWTTEYQRGFTLFSEDPDRDALVTGIRIVF